MKETVESAARFPIRILLACITWRELETVKDRDAASASPVIFVYVWDEEETIGVELSTVFGQFDGNVIMIDPLLGT